MDSHHMPCLTRPGLRSRRMCPRRSSASSWKNYATRSRTPTTRPRRTRTKHHSRDGIHPGSRPGAARKHQTTIGGGTMFTTAVTSVLLAGVTITGNYPGAESIGLEEDHPAVAAALDAHESTICMDAVGSYVTDEAHGITDMPAEFLLDGDCEPLPGNDWLTTW